MCHYAYDLPKVFCLCRVGGEWRPLRPGLSIRGIWHGRMLWPPLAISIRGLSPRGRSALVLLGRKAVQGGRLIRWDTNGRQDTLLTQSTAKSESPFYVPSLDERSLHPYRQPRAWPSGQYRAGTGRFLVSDCALLCRTRMRYPFPYGDWIFVRRRGAPRASSGSIGFQSREASRSSWVTSRVTQSQDWVPATYG